MRSNSKRFRMACLVVFLGAMTACERDQGLTSPAAASTGALGRTRLSSALVALPELADTIRELRVDPIRHFATPPLSDADLIQAVRVSGGVVAIGLKRPTAAPTRSSGRFEAMSRAAALALRSELFRAGVTFIHTFRNSASVIARITPELAPQLRRMPIVNYLEPPINFAPLQQFAPQVVDTSVQLTGAPTVWATYGVTGQSATITIIDTGIDSTHFWNPLGDGPANLGYCGYVTSVATTCYSHAIFPHGAAVAGVVSGRNNCCGLVGVAYNPAMTNEIKVADDNQVFSDNAIALALDWATSSGYPRHIVNMSFGGCRMAPIVSEAIGHANAAGILLIVGAGNIEVNCSGELPGDFNVLYPARLAEVLAVSGTNWDDSFASGKSRYGPEVALSAPFYATLMAANGFILGPLGGTSISAPIVAGVAALVWSQHPDWPASAVVARLEASAVDNYTPGRDQFFGFGRVSAINAVQNPFTAGISGPSTITSAGTYTWSAAGSGASAPYTYSWAYRNQGSGNWITLSSGATTSRTVSSSTQNFTIRVTASSPTWQGTAVRTMNVASEIGGGCTPYCE